MSSDNPGSAASSGAMSETPPSKLSEQAYLAMQAQKARDAISQTLHEMADTVQNMADPRAWIEQHPWASLGAGAAMGFLLASTVTPSKDQTISDRLKSLIPERQPKEPQPVFYVANPPAGQSKFLAPIIDVLKTAVAATISSAITSNAAAASEAGNNGQPPDQPASPS